MHDLFVRGGPLMWPLLMCSIVSLAIVVERIVFWARLGRNTDQKCLERFFEHSTRGEFDKAAEVMRNSRDYVGVVLAQGLNCRSSWVSEVMETAAMDEMEQDEARYDDS